MTERMNRIGVVPHLESRLTESPLGRRHVSQPGSLQAWFDESNDRQIIAAKQKAQSPRDSGSGEQRLEDAHIGEMIARKHLEGRFLHAVGLGWLKFDGRKWTPVAETQVSEVIRKALIDFQKAEAERGADTDRLKRIAGMLSANRIRGITFIAKLRQTTDRDFDDEPDLLNVRNGVVDLRTGSLRPHDCNLLLTKVALVDYVPGARHGDWTQALSAIPEEAQSWFQVRVGQSLTGYPVPDDRLLVLKGSGANGKTTVIDAIREALGPDYAVTMPERVLLARQGDHPTELMALRGARLTLMEEFPEIGHLNVKRLKDLLGTGEMTARYCGKDTVAWKPTHTPVVTTNYLPRVDESDDGTWRRLLLLEFPFRYRAKGENGQTPVNRTVDPTLRERLRRGADGQREAVLAWLVAGAVQWHRDSQVMPAEPLCVLEATQRWRRNSDLLLRYIDDCVVFDSASHVVATELFAHFNLWLKNSGHREWSDQSFSNRLGQHSEVVTHGVEKKRGIRFTRPGLSRPPRFLATGGELRPDAFTAWLGLRFQNDREGRD